MVTITRCQKTTYLNPGPGKSENWTDLRDKKSPDSMNLPGSVDFKRTDPLRRYTDLDLKRGSEYLPPLSAQTGRARRICEMACLGDSLSI
ncbi:MAG: hypothetical protein R3C11_22495 [Planctomycetaceae bacterium]